MISQPCLVLLFVRAPTSIAHELRLVASVDCAADSRVTAVVCHHSLHRNSFSFRLVQYLYLIGVNEDIVCVLIHNWRPEARRDISRLWNQISTL